MCKARSEFINYNYTRNIFKKKINGVDGKGFYI
jgi:hypothetical protein